MFRVYTFLSVLVTFSYAFISFFHYNDDFGWEIFFYDKVTDIALITLIVLLVLKIQVRWQKTWITRKIEGFKMTKQGWKKALISELMSMFIILFIGAMLFVFYGDSVLIPLVLFGYIIESLSSVVIGKLKYKLVITSKLIFIITNKQKMYYWNDVKSFTNRHNGLIVQLKNGIQFHLNEDDFKDSKEWLSSLHSIAVEKEIYWE
jgi:hypothetical protein